MAELAPAPVNGAFPGEEIGAFAQRLLRAAKAGAIVASGYHNDRLLVARPSDHAHDVVARAIAPRPSPSVEGHRIARMARAFSLWLNSTYPADIGEEAVLWRRVTKVCEESGEVRDALGAYIGENPRKPLGPLADVLAELADRVGAALGAIEHLTGHEGRSLDIATERVQFVCERVGVDVE